MSPSDSDTAPNGFTLIELMVAMLVAVGIGVITVKFYKDSYRTYSTQEQVADRNQNAHFTLNKVTELLQQAGTSLPDTGWTVMRRGTGSIILGINPRGAEQFIGTDLPFSKFVPVSDASQFANTTNVTLNTTHVLVDYLNPLTKTEKLKIDEGYALRDFKNGVKDNKTGLDSIRLTTGIALKEGDKVYGYREDEYLLVNGNLVVRPNGAAEKQIVLAESIDSIGYTFLNAAGAPAEDWTKMRSVSVTVRARTERPDPKLPGRGYRMITLPMNVMLRNKI